MPQPLGDVDRPFFFTSSTASGRFRYRGLAHRFPGGEVALVAQNLHEAREFDEAFLQTAFWGGLLTALLGLGGAVVVAVGTVRRFDAAAFAIQEIMRGDLSRRLPTGGTSSDLDRLVIVVNAMLDEIERLMGEVKGVCDGIAHDLRTPLTRIVAGLERVQRRTPAPEGYAAAVDDAVAELRAVLRTFSAMLRIAEIEDGARRKGFQDVDLATIVQDVVDFHEPVAEDRSIALSFEHDPERITVLSGDPGLLFTAISNLVDNALKFTPPHGRVSVGLHDSDGMLAIVVSDTGYGIDPDERNAVFRRFYRSEDSRHTPGNGLGLALVAAVARLHDLSVAIEQLTPGTRIALIHRPMTPPGTDRS
ncbi:sensor histidine kinase [Sphingomonas nostoxanthinifaciens]|uniref:sensor histidine kinase n=1 Tax=Sphingomonas nostoxanthinifaciens TaxID=2872652 RepID=UPI001CC1FC73|nr:HAMP domain-containing sensor histidine kinase [Sphingomonas nostoxanthinifaciens]